MVTDLAKDAQKEFYNQVVSGIKPKICEVHNVDDHFDIALAFCLVQSRVGTDIDTALMKFSGKVHMSRRR